MKFFQNRAVAFVIAAAVVVGSTAANCAVGLHRETERIEESFFTAEDGKAPNYYIDQVISAAASLATVAGHYEGTEQSVAELRSCRAELVEEQREHEISDMYTALSQLTRSAKALAAQLAGISSMTSEDRDTLADAETTVDGAVRKLESSGYNDAVLRFSQGGAYQRLWCELLDIDGPELFDAPFD